MRTRRAGHAAEGEDGVDAARWSRAAMRVVTGIQDRGEQSRMEAQRDWVSVNTLRPSDVSANAGEHMVCNRN